MKSTIILLLAFQFCFVNNWLLADNSDLDSLQNMLTSAKDVEQKVDLLNEIAHAYYSKDESISRQYAMQALNLAQKNEYKNGIGHSYFILAFVSELTNLDSAVFYYNRSLNYFTQTNNDYFLAQVYNNLGLIQKDKGEYQNALDNFFKAIPYIKGKEHLGMIYNNIGIVFRRSGSYDQAIEYFIKSISIREELKDLTGLAITNGNLGNLYLDQKQYAKALEYYENAKTIFSKLNNLLFEAQALQNIGIINTYTKNYEEALINFNSALEIFQKIDYTTGSANTYINKARLYSELQNFDEALDNNLRAIEILKKFNNKEYLASAYIEAGKAYLQLKNYNEAKEFFKTGLAIAKEIGNKQKEADGYDGLYKYHEALKMYPEALQFYKSYILLKDSLFNEDVSKEMSNILSNVEIEKREKEKALLQERIRRKELENKGLVGGAIFLLLFAVYFYKTTQQKKRTNNLLSSQNKEINQKQQQIISINESLQKSQAQLYKLNDELQKLNSSLEITVKERTKELQKSHEELDTFLYQSSHALRRPIVNIMGLVQIAKIEPEFASMPNIYTKIEDTAIRMDMMLKKLVMVSEINLSEQTIEQIDLDDLLAETISSLATELLYKKIKLNKNIKVSQCFKSDKRLFQIILHNLLENAIQFSDDRDGRKALIDIEVRNDHEIINIIVKDNGIGIPNELIDQVTNMFYVATTRSKGYGLGLYIVKKAVEKLKGKIHIESKENEYSCITVAVPVFCKTQNIHNI